MMTTGEMKGGKGDTFGINLGGPYVLENVLLSYGTTDTYFDKSGLNLTLTSCLTCDFYIYITLTFASKSTLLM